mmetsp:Transcript_5370/g.13998  ORF Transcript_5370/g.13998 Transcript_5370/m.13998 type:complete len:129 (+) Transcript_5370:1317-1703(+)
MAKIAGAYTVDADGGLGSCMQSSDASFVTAPAQRSNSDSNRGRPSSIAGIFRVRRTTSRNTNGAGRLEAGSGPQASGSQILPTETASVTAANGEQVEQSPAEQAQEGVVNRRRASTGWVDGGGAAAGD